MVDAPRRDLSGHLDERPFNERCHPSGPLMRIRSELRWGCQAPFHRLDNGQLELLWVSSLLGRIQRPGLGVGPGSLRASCHEDRALAAGWT